MVLGEKHGTNYLPCTFFRSKPLKEILQISVSKRPSVEIASVKLT